MPGLKLKWDASGGKTIHEGALVLVGFMWSLSVPTRLFSFEVIGYLLQPYFLKMMRIPYKVYHLMYVTTLSCMCKKRIKRKKKIKERETKQKKQS